MKGWKLSQGIIKLPRLTAEIFRVLTELTCLCASTNYSADKKGPFVFLIFYHPSQSQWSSDPRWLVLEPPELSGAVYPSFSPPSPPVQDAKGSLLLWMVTENMDFEARLPYYKMSKEKTNQTCGFAEASPMSSELWWFSLDNLNCWRPNERVWARHSLI